MIINFDKKYCASPDCVGACGRKLPNNTPQELLNRIWFGYFCGEPVNDKNHLPNIAKMV